jgi:bifunctional non-homologous end joining protein LigD
MGLRNESPAPALNRCSVLEFSVALQRKKQPPIGVKAPHPGFIPPALATKIDKPPTGERWVHEIKFDGYRNQLHIANDDIKVFTRNGNDWTKRFRKIAADAYLINAKSAIIDGEVVVPAADGTTDSQSYRTNSRARPTRSSWWLST